MFCVAMYVADSPSVSPEMRIRFCCRSTVVFTGPLNFVEVCPRPTWRVSLVTFMLAASSARKVELGYDLIVKFSYGTERIYCTS